MNTRKPTIVNEGLYAQHDQCCAVIHSEPAVMDCATWVFHPSWKAQAEGWRLVKADSRFKRWILRAAFPTRAE
jgi:hypothetical protein